MRTVAGITVGIFLSAACMATAYAAQPSYLEAVIKNKQLRPSDTSKLSKRNQAMLRMADAAQTKRELAKKAHDDKGK